MFAPIEPQFPIELNELGADLLPLAGIAGEKIGDPWSRPSLPGVFEAIENCFMPPDFVPHIRWG
jgi:hypothetical protein